MSIATVISRAGFVVLMLGASTVFAADPSQPLAPGQLFKPRPTFNGAMTGQTEEPVTKAPRPKTPAPSELHSGLNLLHNRPAVGDQSMVPFKRPKQDNPNREGAMALARRNILAAWFSGALLKYRHSPFETESHPEVLTVSLADQRVLRFRLPADSVFEDRNPRVVDFDGDGTDEIVVIRSYLKKGSALAIIGERGGKLEIVAETPAIGEPLQWLNPAGFADFDGDGKPDIALVVNPNKAGELQFWSMRDGEFEKLAETTDVSNHVVRTKNQGLSAVSDFDGDGIADLAIPSQDRRSLRFFSLAGGTLRDLGSAALRQPASEDFEITQVDGNPAVRVGFPGGRKAVIVPCRDVDEWRMAKGAVCK